MSGLVYGIVAGALVALVLVSTSLGIHLKWEESADDFSGPAAMGILLALLWPITFVVACVAGVLYACHRAIGAALRVTGRLS